MRMGKKGRRRRTRLDLLLDVCLMDFVFLLFTRMPGESKRGRLRHLLLLLCDVYRALINSLVC